MLSEFAPRHVCPGHVLIVAGWDCVSERTIAPSERDHWQTEVGRLADHVDLLQVRTAPPAPPLP